MGITVPTQDILDQMGRMLVEHGFIVNADYKGNNIRGLYTYDPVKKRFRRKDGQPIDPDHALMEYAEEVLIIGPHQGASDDHPTEYIPTGYPSPLKRYHLVYESFQISIEEVYFWLLDHIRYEAGFSRAYKVKDIFSATENSAFFGNSQQRLGIQQDRAQQYLASIGKMVKDLFQLVRELRILDEKLEPRKQWKTLKSADATLKGDYVDLVENRGGQTSPGSVYGLAQQLGYAALPDLFFNLHVYSLKQVDAEVEKLKYNKNVKSVLKRKLYQFINWKEKTDHELEARRRFTLKYLRQHWDVIEMYMSWVKPYLRHIARLTMNDQMLGSAEMISAFEQSYVETEVLFAKPSGKKFDVIVYSIDFRTRPDMRYTQEGYQKGPLHVGKADINLRAYIWEQHHIDQYLAFRRREDLYMLGVVDKSVQSAMEALGEELEGYLAEAGEPKYREKVEAEKKAHEEMAKNRGGAPSMFSGVFEPFTALGGGFAEILGLKGMGSLFSADFKRKKEKAWTFPGSIGTGTRLGKDFSEPLYQAQKNFKKSHGMLSFG
jgi:hypothetical protein